MRKFHEKYENAPVEKRRKYVDKFETQMRFAGRCRFFYQVSCCVHTIVEFEFYVDDFKQIEFE